MARKRVRPVLFIFVLVVAGKQGRFGKVPCGAQHERYLGESRFVLVTLGQDPGPRAVGTLGGSR